MGLDIRIEVDNEEAIFTLEYSSHKKLHESHYVSRTFCNFMFRQYSSNTFPELDQIGELTGLDITPLYDMENYMTEKDIEEQLLEFEEEWQKKNFLKTVKSENEKLKGNVEIVNELLSKLIDKLSKIKNLNEKLDHGDFDTLNSSYYFSDFNSAPGHNYVNNNFGQDLRNLKQFIEYIKTKGTTTVYFRYG